MNKIKIDVPSVSLLVGKPGSGKSTLLRQIIYNLALNKSIDYMYIFCETSFNKETNKYDFLDERFICNNYNVNTVKKVIWKQKEEIENGSNKNLLIVFDDVAGIDFKSKFWQKVISNYRHYRLTLLFAIQYIKSILPPIFRTCSRYAMIYFTDDTDSLEAIKKTYMMNFKKNQDVYDYISKNTGDYKFIFIDRQQVNKNRYSIKKASNNIPKFFIDQ
jgi:adenylate kinase family enzyme